MAISIDFKQIVLISKSVSRYFVDIGRFIFQPREYFSIVSKEKPINTVQRLILYALGFDFLVFSLFYAIGDNRDSLEPFKFSIKLFGIAMLEILVGLIITPAIVLTGQLCKPKIGLRVSIIYSLTFKFVYLLIPIIFYVFFILTENYVFAILRGIIYFLFLIIYFLLFPFLFSTGLKKRVLTVFVSLSSCILTIVVFGYALSYFPNSLQKLKKITILYDPIASEVVKTVSKIHKYPRIGFEEFSRFSNTVNNSIIRGKRIREGYISISLIDIKRGIKQLNLEWGQKGKTYKEELENQLFEIESYLKSVKFSTTKEFLNLKEDEIRSGLIFISKLQELLNSDPSNIVEVFFESRKLQSEYLEKSTIFLRRINDHFGFFLPFRNYGIIIY